MWEKFESVQFPLTDTIRQQYAILEDDLKNPRNKDDFDQQIFLQSLRSRHRALSFMITAYTQWWENMLLRNKYEKEIIQELEIIREALILLDLNGIKKARDFLTKNPIKSNT